MRNKSFLIIIAAAIIIGLIAVFLLVGQSSQQQIEQTSQETSSPLPSPKVFVLNIEDRKLVNSENQKLTINEGEEVTLRVTPDQNAEFHLHGYDILLPLTENETSEIKFVADKSGRFEFELEGTNTTLGVLEVLPK